MEARTFPYSPVIDSVPDQGILDEIVEEALQAFFKVVCERLDDYYPDGTTTGDETPGENWERHEIGRRWLREHALNHPTIGKANPDW